MTSELMTINDELRSLLPGLTLGLVRTSVTVRKKNAKLWNELDFRASKLRKSTSLDRLSKISEIAALSSAYRSIGKDPSRYRGSAEALLRRILQGKSLYQINTVVDTNNLVSLETMHSVGSYDLDRLTPPLTFKIGEDGDSYRGIGKSSINIANLPVFADQQGAYGSPTSDSERAMIRLETQRVLMVIISFCGDAGLESGMKRAERLLQQYSGGSNSEMSLIR